MRFLTELKRRRLFLMSMLGVVPASRAIANEDARREDDVEAQAGGKPLVGTAIQTGGRGVTGTAFGAGGAGVLGTGGENAAGVLGESEGGSGVEGTSGYLGVRGICSSGSAGVSGEFRDAPGGTWKTAGYLGRQTYGVHGISEMDKGVGVYGYAKGGRGVLGESEQWSGVVGLASVEAGVMGRSVTGPGVQGESVEMTHDGVNGFGRVGVRGVTWTAGGGGVVGVFRKGEAASGPTNTESPPAETDGIARGWLGTSMHGVIGESLVPGGHGVGGKTLAEGEGAAIYGQGTGKGPAGYFRGRVTVDGTLLVGELFAKSGMIAGIQKLFKIDHPLDPADKYLMHASIESDERRNLYDGLVTLDDTGAAWVTLPDWFEALNKDFRYQLTCVGGHAPVFVADEICSNRFRIAGGVAGLKVSWMVTGVRQDLLAKARPFVVEERKSASDRGKYLYPEEHGKPETDGIHYQQVASI